MKKQYIIIEMNSQRVDIKERTTLMSSVKKYSSRFIGYFRSFDNFGQPVSLNFDGEDTFKSLPGGLFTLILYMVMGAYSYM
jgi:hypothetical protein